jgi:hypothetical protein
MANYLQDGVGAFPQEQGFTPNYNFIMRTLEMRQNQYDQGFAQLKSTYNSILNSELLHDDNKKSRDQILSNAQYALKDLPTVDLGNPKNVTAAQSVFKPFFENDYILNDMVFTKAIKGQINSGMALQNASKEEDRNRYWNIGIQDLYDQMDQFKESSLDETLGMHARRYVAKPQVSEQVLKMFNDGKLKRSIDRISGQIKYTTENGEELKIPLQNLYMSLAENDAETMEGFNVYGRVQRNRYIKDNVANGRYPSKEAAAEAHDKGLVTDYINIQDRHIKLSSDALTKVETRLKGWNEKLNNGTLTEDEKVKMADDEITQEDLSQRISTFKINKQKAPNTILRNPSQYLGEIYLNKSASDLAEALSAVSGSLKIDANPIYKEFVYPKEFEVFKINEQIRLEREKSALNMLEAQQEAELEAATGKSSTGKSSTKTTTDKNGLTVNSLDIPEVKENAGGSGVAKYYKNTGVADAYGQTKEASLKVISKIFEEKANYVFNVLDANEIVDEKGNLLDQNKMRTLLSNAPLVNNLYKKALDKTEAYRESNPEKYISLLENQEVVNKLNETFAAASNQRKAWLKEIIGNIEATETEAGGKKEVTVTSQNPTMGGTGGGPYVSGSTYKTTEVVPAKDEGWMYKYLVSPSSGLLLEANDADKFIQGIQKDKKFEERVKLRLQENKDAKQINPAFLLFSVFKQLDDPTYEQAKTQVTAELKDNFEKYRDKVINKWNERGLNFENKYAALPGGGGITAKELTWRATNSVQGEKADVLTLDLLTKLPSIAGKDNIFVIAGPNAPDKGKGDGDDELLKLIQNGALSNEVMNAIKLGKDSNLKTYSISSNMVGGNNPDYHAYTLNFDIDFLSKLQGTDSKAAVIDDTTAKKLINGLTIFIKKDKDFTLANSKSTLSEIDILVNTNPQGLLQKELAPGYNLSIQKNPISGGYKIKTSIKEPSKENLDGVPKEFEIIVPAGTDLSSYYYETFSDLRKTFIRNQQLKTDYMKSLPVDEKPTRESIDALKLKLRSNGR